MAGIRHCEVGEWTGRADLCEYWNSHLDVNGLELLHRLRIGRQDRIVLALQESTRPIRTWFKILLPP